MSVVASAMSARAEALTPEDDEAFREARLKRFLTRVKRFGTDRCHYCDLQLTPATATKDHKVPRHAGGTLRDALFACRSCNHHKGPFSYEHFLQSEWLARRRIKVAQGLPIATPDQAEYYYTKRDLPRPQHARSLRNTGQARPIPTPRPKERRITVPISRPRYLESVS